MRCEFCCDRVDAAWWALTRFNLHAWLCDRHKDALAAQDAEGKIIAIPAEERMKAIHERS